MGNCGRTRWQVMKWIMRYLQGTYAIFIEHGRTNIELICFVDYDYGGDIDARKSKAEHPFCLGGSAISWRSGLHDAVALSMIEAEYVTITEACKEVVWLGGLISEFELGKGTLKVHIDSENVVHLAKNQSSFHNCTKRNNIRYHYIHDMIIECKVIWKKVGITDNSVNILINSLQVSKFEHCLDCIGIL